MSEHFEPWRLEKETAHCAYGPCIRDANNWEVLFCACDECRGDRPVIEDADARRIVACVNFCREFPTEALEGRQLVYLKQAQWESLADMPKFDGLMAVRKIDEVGNSPGGTTPPGVM